MANRMKKFVAIFTFILVAQHVFAQPADVIIEGTGNRQIEPAFRITETPKIIDTVKAAPVASYPMLVYQGATEISLDTIEAATVETTEKLKQLYPFYAKIGIGSVIMPLGELYFNSTRSRSNTYGAHIKHLSSFGDVKDRDKVTYAPANFDRTDVKLFGKINESNYNLLGSLHYKNDGFNYYGIPIDSIAKDSISQRFQQVGGDFEFIGNRGDTSILNYKISTGYSYLTTKKPIIDSLADWKTQDHDFYIKTKLWYNYKTEKFYGNLGVRYNGYRYGIQDSVISPIDSGLVRNNTIIDFHPGVLTMKAGNRLKVNLGVLLSIDIQEKAKAYIYPMAEVKYSFVNDMFIPFIGIRGGLKQTSFRSLAAENQFVLTNVQLQNEHNPFDIYAGFKGNLSKRMTFNVNLSYAKIMNKALFVNDTIYSLGNKFNVIYDTLNQMKVEASLTYQLNEKLKIDGIGRFYSYETKNQAFAWNLPQLQFMVRGAYNLYDKFLVNLEGNFETGRKALVYGPGKDVKQENGQYYRALGTIIDLNLGFEYRYNTRVSAFLQFNNLAAQRYNRWLSYPVQGFQVMGGITARF